MSLASGVRLGPYEILSPIGAGGMGEVYRARDTRLGRTVALKILLEDSAPDPDRRRRFEQEARAASALNHPNICALYDIGTHEGTDYLVMEYLEGRTLAAWIAERAGVRSMAALREALAYAIQIADALGRAHQEGIVHRDLKPGNVMLTATGAGRSGVLQVKLLDFGLAKLKASAVGARDLTTMANRQSPATEKGAILGTLAYMAPEQLEGGDVDARADIFAFGAVLYEMLTGTPAFGRASGASTIAAIIDHTPPSASTSVALTPPVLDRVVARCLAKHRDDRWHSAQDLAAELRWILESIDSGQTSTAAGQPSGRRGSRSRRAALLAAVATVALALGIVAGWTAGSRRGTPSPPTTRVQVGLEPSEGLPMRGRSFALSPDGRTIAFVGTVGPRTALFVRPLGARSATLLEGTTGATQPVFSPDGRSLAYYGGNLSAGALLRIPASGGPVQVVVKRLSAMPYGIAWLNDRELVVEPESGPLMRVAVDGGDPRPLTTLAPGEISHRLPNVLPDGQGLLYTSRLTMMLGGMRVMAAAADGTSPKVILDNAADARYARSGHVLFMRQGTLMAASFDAAARAVTGSPVAVVSDIVQYAAAWNSGPIAGAGLFDVAESGSLAYVGGPIFGIPTELVWLDRAGRLAPAVGGFRGDAPMARVSPDGTRIAFATNDAVSDAGMWVLDLSRGTRTRIPHDGEPLMPVWTHDGRQLIFSSLVRGKRVIVRHRADGAGTEEVLRETAGMIAAALSPDGKTLALINETSDTPAIWRMNLGEGDRTPRQWLQSKFAYENPEFSPDGRWLAFNSTETGTREVYIQEIEGTGPRIRISTGGGLAPTWHPSGREIIFSGRFTEARKPWVMAVTVDLAPGRPPRIGTERPVAAVPDGVTFGSIPIRSYDAAPDGSRYLALRRIPEARAPTLHLNLVEYWFDELKQLAPARGAR